MSFEMKPAERPWQDVAAELQKTLVQMLRAGGNCRNIDDTTLLRRVRQFYVARRQTETAAKTQRRDVEDGNNLKSAQRLT